MAQHQKLLDPVREEREASRQSSDSFSSAGSIEEDFPKSKRRIGPWGCVVAIVGLLALSGSLLVALSWSWTRQQAYQMHADVAKMDADSALTLYGGQYPIQHDAIGAYITCPLDSPEAARQAGCTFDVLFHGYIPDPCLDHDVYQYWHRDRLGDLEWRESEESAQPIPIAEILRGDLAKYPTAWAPTTVHYYHCLYLFNGSSRAQSRLSPLVLDTHLDESHMNHCLNIIMSPPEYFPATFLFAYQHRCYIRDLSNWTEGTVPFIQKMKSQAEELVSG